MITFKFAVQQSSDSTVRFNGEVDDVHCSRFFQETLHIRYTSQDTIKY